jgi:hypothetical protein
MIKPCVVYREKKVFPEFFRNITGLCKTASILIVWFHTLTITENVSSFAPQLTSPSLTLAPRLFRSFDGNFRAVVQSDDGELSEFRQIDPSEENGNINIPATGISINDEIESAQKDRFVTDLVPINGLRDVAAQIVTTSSVSGSFEPVRYIVALTPPKLGKVPLTEGNSTPLDFPMATSNTTDFVIVDVPPYSQQLADQIKEFLSVNNGELRSILITCRDSIHYDEAPAVYSTRRADLESWCQSFPDLSIIAYRLDIPRDCRFAITQVLDGYGPFALQKDSDHGNPFKFVETGRPLSIVEWDHSVAQDVFCGKPPPDDEVEPLPDIDESDMYSPAAIRKREAGKHLLAVFTPGYSFGSVSYIFPRTGICCSGFTIPIEDNRYDENLGIGGSTGPALDCRGYIALSKDRKRQMESAKKLVRTYIDQFHILLPSRGDPFFLDDDVEERKEVLLDTITQYEKIGAIYEQLGIVSNEGGL